MPKTKEQYDEQKHEKRELILNTALEVFATHGFHGASISTIAQHAGIAKGLMYTYFESKEELLKEIIAKVVKELTTLFQSNSNEELTTEKFGKLIKQFFKQLKENKDFWRLYYAIAMQPSVFEIIEDEFGDVGAPYKSILVKYYQKMGSQNPEADAMFADSLIDGIAINCVMTHHQFDLNIIEDTVIERLTRPCK